MGRRKKEQESDTTMGEQLELIDVTPENVKEIKPLAREYKAAQRRRLAALQEEVEIKGKLLELVKKMKLHRLADGSIKFNCGGPVVKITPRDEKVTVTEEGEQDDEDGGE